MRKLFYLTCILCCFSSCGNNHNNEDHSGKKFSPIVRESNVPKDSVMSYTKNKSLSSAESQNEHSIQFTVIKPEVNDIISSNVADCIGHRLLQIASLYGLSGRSGSPIFVLGSQLLVTKKEFTSTAPQKVIVSLDAILYTGNVITDEIYASISVPLSGVGSSLEDALNNACLSLSNSEQIQSLLSDSSEKIIAWYESNQKVLSMQVDKAVAEENYILALSLLSAVPSQATKCFNYATGKYSMVLELYFNSKASDSYAMMHSAIAEAKGDFSPQVGAYFSMIPSNSSIYINAEKEYLEYCSKVQINDEKQKLIEREQAAILSEREHQANMAKMEYDAKVAIAQSRTSRRSNRGNGILGLGKLFDNIGDITNRIMDNF